MTYRVALIEERLRAALTLESLDIIDESSAHAGHAGAREGGHFTVHLVSSAFAGKTLIQRHRLVNAALADLMRQEIHALSIRARAPDET
ncbi:MAG: BolA family transcriptional regulator [Candidatus Contendobacter sp.]|nr:BolA family transcriptional regulator [Candidatus Contendobacter sp.]MCC8999243.1 BolA family transcriptional regulator [Candidatus Contendobacter sp.]